MKIGTWRHITGLVGKRQSFGKKCLSGHSSWIWHGGSAVHPIDLNPWETWGLVYYVLASVLLQFQPHLTFRLPRIMTASVLYLWNLYIASIHYLCRTRAQVKQNLLNLNVFFNDFFISRWKHMACHSFESSGQASSKEWSHHTIFSTNNKDSNLDASFICQFKQSFNP